MKSECFRTPRAPARGVTSLIAFAFLAILPARFANAQLTFFEVLIENTSATFEHRSSGVFNTPVGAAGPAPIGPGEAYEFTVYAHPGDALSFATMFIPSNDLFYGPGGEGIALWDNEGNQISGDVTDQVSLWDAGTEVNQEPGVGADQAQRQSGADTGADDPDPLVRAVSDGFVYPAVTDVVSVTVTPATAFSFVVRIENVSTGTTLQPSDNSMQPVPLAPGVWVVHGDPNPLFESGASDRGLGLEAIAEDGDPAMLASNLADISGVPQIFSPGVWVVHDTAEPLFTSDQVDRGDGLVAIAEDGDPAALAALLRRDAAVTGDAFATPIGAESPAPIGPGGQYRFVVAAEPGASLSLATMLVQSNDLFIAPDESGIPLWVGGSPVSGELSGQLAVWDVGSEVNEMPGFGENQAPRQDGPDTGDDEGGVVRLVDDGFTYPDPADVISVTITPLESRPFIVTITNASTGTTLQPSDNSMQAVPLSPGAFVVHARAHQSSRPGRPTAGSAWRPSPKMGCRADLSGRLTRSRALLRARLTHPTEWAVRPRSDPASPTRSRLWLHLAGICRLPRCLSRRTTSSSHPRQAVFRYLTNPEHRWSETLRRTYCCGMQALRPTKNPA